MSEAMIPPARGKSAKPAKAKAQKFELDADGNPVSAETGAPAEGGEPSTAKVRGPRQDYGYRKGAKIVITDKEQKYHGQRLEWFETLVAFNGQSVDAWEESRKGTVNKKGTAQSPRGWLRFYVLDGTVALEAPAEEAQQEAA